MLREREAGLHRLETYADFAERVRATKRKLLSFLIEAKNCGKSLVGYGAPGKGNTLLNYCGIRADFLDYTVDRNPYKQGKYLPGTHIRIFPPEKISETSRSRGFAARRMVGERRGPLRSWIERTSGAPTSAYAGTSNDKRGGKPLRRKHKVSWGRSIRPGSVGT